MIYQFILTYCKDIFYRWFKELNSSVFRQFEKFVRYFMDIRRADFYNHQNHWGDKYIGDKYSSTLIDLVIMQFALQSFICMRHILNVPIKICLIIFKIVKYQKHNWDIILNNKMKSMLELYHATRDKNSML